jgi:mannose-6-phosphate isomerase-like protein (cupin superfamily)
MTIRVVNLQEKFSQISDYYNPRIVSEINDTAVKLAKLKGEFLWHHHDSEDEMFLVVSGTLRMKVRGLDGDPREHEFLIGPGEFITIPHGVEHLPSSDDEVHIMLIEPKETLNTGNLRNERTRARLETI